MITQKINDLAHVAMMLEDYSTYHCLEWYVAKQNKEEKLSKSTLDKLALVHTDPVAFSLIDQDPKKMNTNNSFYTTL